MVLIARGHKWWYKADVRSMIEKHDTYGKLQRWINESHLPRDYNLVTLELAIQHCPCSWSIILGSFLSRMWHLHYTHIAASHLLAPSAPLPCPSPSITRLVGMRGFTEAMEAFRFAAMPWLRSVNDVAFNRWAIGADHTQLSRWYLSLTLIPLVRSRLRRGVPSLWAWISVSLSQPISSKWKVRSSSQMLWKALSRDSTNTWYQRTSYEAQLTCIKSPISPILTLYHPLRNCLSATGWVHVTCTKYSVA